MLNPAQTDNTLKYDTIKTVTQNNQSWTPNSKYEYYMIVVNVGGYVETAIVPPDYVSQWFSFTVYYDNSNKAFIGVDTGTNSLHYVYAGTGYTVSSIYLRGYYR